MLIEARSIPNRGIIIRASMAGRGCFVGCSFWFVPVLLPLFLLLNVAAVRAAVAGEAPHQLGANCGSIDACRAGVANDACCRGINVAIVQGTCSCACRQLSVYDHPNLAATCGQKSGCPMCRDCKCSRACPWMGIRRTSPTAVM